MRRGAQTIAELGAAFQSTHPLRGATGSPKKDGVFLFISIHAPLAGCDRLYYTAFCAPCHFNPRTPCGVRLIKYIDSDRSDGISIHAPLAGCDFLSSKLMFANEHFNPRTPCGVRLISGVAPVSPVTFQSTHPLRGATVQLGVQRAERRISIHAPLAGCDCRPSRGSRHGLTFQSTHPLRGATSCRSFSIHCSVFQSTHPLRGAT